MTPVEEIAAPEPADFDRIVRPRFTPVVIRGAAEAWPIVAAGRRSAAEALDYIERYDSGAPTSLMVAPPDRQGRFFYNADTSGFNFERKQGSLTQLARHLLGAANENEPIGIYAGATPAASHLPGFEQEHPFPLAEALPDATTRIWLGNATQVATHFDLSDNFAVVALGRRRFTLFPPEATGDLYVGPLDMTLAGQPVSMVDPLAPDLERYPRYAAAQEQAQFAELEPGDAIYIPTLWWHHVQASDAINILVNYWHNDALRGGGFLALIHAILAIRDQPQGQRDAWRAWFDHFVFGEKASHAADHLPPAFAHGDGPTLAPARRDDPPLPAAGAR